MKRYYILFKGRVQGVGFRRTFAHLAKTYCLTGYCRNLFDGNVEAEVQGNEKDIDKLLADILKNQGFIRVDDYHLKRIEIIDDEKFFRILY